jgi:hypothetical protein
MDNGYYVETLTRQRLEEAARHARTAHQRPHPKTRAGWHFPKVSFPGRPHVATARPA